MMKLIYLNFLNINDDYVLLVRVLLHDDHVRNIKVFHFRQVNRIHVHDDDRIRTTNKLIDIFTFSTLCFHLLTPTNIL